jgi:hypothetical protein
LFFYGVIVCHGHSQKIDGLNDIRWVAKVKPLRETASWRGSESALNFKRKRLGRDLIWVTVPIVVRTMFKKKRDRTAAQPKEHKRVAAIFE